jgi:hypothetical protein
MSPVLRGSAWALVFLAIGVAIGLAVALPQSASATHTTTISYVQRGLLGGSVKCAAWYQFADAHYCWHEDEPDVRWHALDLNIGNDPNLTAGASVYFYYLGDSQHFKIIDIPYATNCTGVAAQLYWRYVGNPAYEEGTINYLHIDPTPGIVGTVPGSFKWLGTVSYSQPGCPWFGPHLHQSAESFGDYPFYFNRWENPDHEYYHDHTIYWPYPLLSDADSDSYTDNVEVRLSTDPQDACGDTTTPYDERGFDYYEPISPWPPDFDDSQIVNIIDLNVLLPPPLGSWGATSGDPLYYARRDLVPDGVINMIDLNKVLPPPLGAWGQTCT